MNAARLLVPLALLGLLSAAWLKGGWPALALAASGVVLWALLHCTRLLAVSQLSNVLGCWQPLDQLLHLAKAQGALTVVDGDVVGELVDRFFEVVTEQDVAVQLDRLDTFQQTEQAAREPPALTRRGE